MAKVKTPKAAKPSVELRIESAMVEMVDISKIVSNTAQSRGMGVLSTLQEEGWGLFKSLVEDKEPLWSMLLSKKPEDRQQAILLIEESEPELVELEESTGQVQLQPVGVWEIRPGEMDVIFGMRRLLAEALRCARNGKTTEVESKVFTFNRKPSQAELMVLALKENKDRKSESPLDLAITFKKLEKDGLTPDEIGKSVGYSGQNVRNYMKLLHPKLEKYRARIHSGELKLDPALKILKKAKEGGTAAREGTNGEERHRLPNVKKIQEIYESGSKPEKMDQEEWDLWTSEDVRKLLALKLGFTYTPFVAKAAPTPASAAEGNGESKKPGKTFNIKREKAKQLLISLGKTDARNWKDEQLVKKLENIVSVAEEGQKVEKENLQTLLDKLWSSFKDGYKVVILDDDKKAK
jgi:hypothetical protein